MFWSNSFGAKACFGATLHHFLNKSFFWSNTPSLLDQKLVLEQPSITFRAKYCFGATLHHFWSKSLFWSSTPSLFVQKLVLEQHSIVFQTKKDEVICGPVRSGPVRPVRSSALGPRRLDRTDRMDRTGPDGPDGAGPRGHLLLHSTIEQ